MNMNKTTIATGDIRVFGTVHPTHLVEDLGIDVPHGVTMTIPAEQALRSKDLWRGISQKCLFQLPSTVPAQFSAQPLSALPDPERQSLLARIRDLEEQVRALETENRALKEVAKGSEAREVKLDTILAALQGGVALRGAAQIEPRVVRVKEEVADGSAPTFLPSQIKPIDVDQHIEIQKESTSSSSVTNTAERLRKIRQGAAQDPVDQ
jgi:hypothetical protein